MRSIVCMPPQHGKSEMLSHWGPVWALEQAPGLRLGVVSYEADVAAQWGRRVRNTIQSHARELAVRIAPDSDAASRWHSNDPQGLGGMVSAGVGGPLTGRRIDLLIIDDPVKNSAQVRSDTYREQTWEWWVATAQPRLAPGGSAILVMTRWHEDDLAGRLIAGGGWHVISLPALAEDDDPLGRAPGEALWPSQYPADCPKFQEAQRYSLTWNALYQQRPQPAEGAVFARRHFRSWRPCADGEGFMLLGPDGGVDDILGRDAIWIGQTADLAMTTRSSSDWTVVETWGYGSEGQMILLEVDRQRLEVPDQLAHLQAVARRWAPHPGYRWLAVEQKGSGIGVLQEARRRGIRIRALRADADKVTRASALAVAYQQGVVYHRADAPWLPAYEAELLSFPRGAHDDQVDCAAYAAMEMRSVEVPVWIA